MDEKGGDRPSRTIRPTRFEASGVRVKPGNYKAIMSFGDQTSETNIEVKTDPRIEVNMNSVNEVYTASKEVQDLNQSAADAVKQLVESKNIANEYSKMLAKLDKEKHKDDIKASKDISKKIDQIIAIYLGKVDKRQGITSDPTVNVVERIGGASFYAGTRQNGITSTERTLLKHAKDALNEAIDKTNTFFIEEWAPYKEKMEAIEISPFKEVKTINKH